MGAQDADFPEPDAPEVSAPEVVAPVVEAPDKASFFSYTSGRYLFNEDVRLKERHVVFNVEALQRAAEASVGNKHGKVVGIKKLAEGGFNRVFVLELQDGFELIAKIPYHIARPAYFTTASEAATLAFLRLKGIPVPEVYGYSAAAENPVGAEYIFMEKAPGVCLSSKWTNLQDVEIGRLAQGFVDLEKQFSNIPFSATGSLYFKKDIESGLQISLDAEKDGPEADQFCIGPVADYMFWNGKRAGLNLNRGPWKNGVEFLRSIGTKEIEWTKRYGKPMEPDFPHNDLGMGIQHPEDYIKLLELYQSLTPHLLPKDPAHPFNQPILRHPDLTPGNIFVTPETGKLSCLIDWQHTIIQPRLLAAGYPRVFENPDSEVPPVLIRPKLPDDFESLQEEDKMAVKVLYRQRLLFYFYRVFNGALNKPHLAALDDPLLLLRHMLLDQACRQFRGDLITLKAAIVRTVQFWEHLPDVEGIKCPIHFEQAELDEFAEKENEWLIMNMEVEKWRGRVCGMNEEGWVRNEEYEEAKKKLEDLTEEIRLQCEGDEEDIQAFRTGWPFRDREDHD